MADLLQRASAWLEEQRRKHCSQLVTYQRGSASAEIPATIGRTVFSLDDGDAGLLQVESRDYLITASDLVLDGLQTLPQRGDQVRETAGEQTFLYEVMAPGDEPCWRYSDPYRQTLRIHTNQVEAS